MKTNKLVIYLLIFLVSTCGNCDVDKNRDQNTETEDQNTETEKRTLDYELEFIVCNIEDNNTDFKEEQVLSTAASHIYVAKDEMILFVYNIYKNEQEFYLKDGIENKKKHKAGDIKGETKRIKLGESEIKDQFNVTEVTGNTSIDQFIGKWDQGVFIIEFVNNATTNMNNSKLKFKIENKKDKKYVMSKEYSFNLKSTYD